jgi:hypothetical protein
MAADSLQRAFVSAAQHVHISSRHSRYGRRGEETKAEEKGRGQRRGERGGEGLWEGR